MLMCMRVRASYMSLKENSSHNNKMMNIHMDAGPIWGLEPCSGDDGRGSGWWRGYKISSRFRIYETQAWFDVIFAKTYMSCLGLCTSVFGKMFGPHPKLVKIYGLIMSFLIMSVFLFDHVRIFVTWSNRFSPILGVGRTFFGHDRFDHVRIFAGW